MSVTNDSGSDASANFVDDHRDSHGDTLLSNAPRFPAILTLNISGRKYQISRAILEEESPLFARLLSDSMTWNPEEDGSYFLDVDPGIFEHVVRFMRRPEVYPVFYDQARGFDYDLYNRLQAEAEYFEIDVLAKWIKEKVR